VISRQLKVTQGDLLVLQELGFLWKKLPQNFGNLMKSCLTFSNALEEQHLHYSFKIFFKSTEYEKPGNSSLHCL